MDEHFLVSKSGTRFKKTKHLLNRPASKVSFMREINKKESNDLMSSFDRSDHCIVCDHVSSNFEGSDQYAYLI